MNKIFNQNRENGAVSMLTVIFFVLFLSIVSVGFMRLVNDERNRSLNNELSSAALAAQAGIEDGKRILVYCEQNPAKSECSHITTNSGDDCSTLINTFTNIIHSEDGEGVIDDINGKYAERYTCLYIQKYTSNIEFNLSTVDSKNADQSSSVVFPLDIVDSATKAPVSSVDQVNIQWHYISDDIQNGDGPLTNIPSVNNNPKKENWDGPAWLRVEVVRVPNGTFSMGQLESDSAAITMRPNGSSNNNIATIDTNTEKKSPNESVVPLTDVKCQANTSAVWSCSANIKLANFAGGENYFNLANAKYYFRVTALYRDTTISVSVPGSAAQQFVFNGIQPLIDSTGRVDNTFRRVITRVAPNASIAGDMMFPEYTIESANKVCKQMKVLDDTGSDLCQY